MQGLNLNDETNSELKWTWNQKFYKTILLILSSLIIFLCFYIVILKTNTLYAFPPMILSGVLTFFFIYFLYKFVSKYIYNDWPILILIIMIVVFGILLLYFIIYKPSNFRSEFILNYFSMFIIFIYYTQRINQSCKIRTLQIDSNILVILKRFIIYLIIILGIKVLNRYNIISKEGIVYSLISLVIILIIFELMYFMYIYFIKGYSPEVKSDIYIYISEMKEQINDNDSSEEINNKYRILPFYSTSEEFVPIEIEPSSKNEEIYVYTVSNTSRRIFDNEAFKCKEDNKHETFIVPYRNNRPYKVYCKFVKKGKKDKYGYIKFSVIKHENCYAIKDVYKSEFLISKIACFKFSWYKRCIRNKKYFDDYIKKIIQNATYNERYGMTSKTVNGFKDSEYFAIYYNKPYGYGKTTYSIMLSEKYDFKAISITPQETKDININYNILKECYKNISSLETMLKVCSCFMKSIYFYAYLFSISAVLLTLLNIIYNGNMYDIKLDMLVGFLITFILILIMFPSLIGFRGHKNAGLNDLYIKTIGVILKKENLCIYIENFDRHQYDNFENLFILLDGLNKYDLKSAENKKFVINAYYDNLKKENRNDFIYNIEKHCSFYLSNEIDPTDYLNKILNEYDEYLTSNIKESVKESKAIVEKNKKYINFRDCTRLKGILSIFCSSRKHIYEVVPVLIKYILMFFTIGTIYTIDKLYNASHNMLVYIIVICVIAITIIVESLKEQIETKVLAFTIIIFTILFLITMYIVLDLLGHNLLANENSIKRVSQSSVTLFLILISGVIFNMFSSINRIEEEKQDDELEEKIKAFWSKKEERIKALEFKRK